MKKSYCTILEHNDTGRFSTAKQSYHCFGGSSCDAIKTLAKGGVRGTEAKLLRLAIDFCRH